MHNSLCMKKNSKLDRVKVDMTFVYKVEISVEFKPTEVHVDQHNCQ